MSSNSRSNSKRYMGRMGVWLLVLMVLFSMAAPILTDCHVNEMDHSACATVHGCCGSHVSAVSTASISLPILLTLNSSLLAGDMPSTGITISDAPFQPPRS